MVETAQNSGTATWNWREAQCPQEAATANWPHSVPEKPTPGQGWYDEAEDCLYVWDGEDWVTMPQD